MNKALKQWLVLSNIFIAVAGLTIIFRYFDRDSAYYHASYPLIGNICSDCSIPVLWLGVALILISIVLSTIFEPEPWKRMLKRLTKEDVSTPRKSPD